MGRAMTWIMILVTMTIIMNFAFNTNTTWIMGQILGFENSGDFTASAFWIALVAATAFIGLTGIVAGFGTGTQIDTNSLMRKSFATAVLFVFVSDYTSILSKLRAITCTAGGVCGWEWYVGFAIMIPIFVGYSISVIDWIGGNDL